MRSEQDYNPKMLVYISSPAQFKFFRSYFECLKQSFEFIFFLDETNHELKNETTWLNENKLQKISLDFSVIQNTTLSFSKRLYNKLFRNTFLSGLPVIYKSEKLKTNVIKAAFVKHKPKLFLSFEDNFGLALNFVKAARQTLTQSVVIPFTVANHEELGYIFSKLEDYKINTTSKNIFYTFFPKWVTNFRGIKTTCDQPAHILARALLKLNPANPFICVGGNSDTVLFESDFVKDYYLKSGLTRKAIRLCPSPAFVPVNKEIKTENPGSNPKVLCSLPPDYYANPHFKNYREILDFWLSALLKNKIDLTISLHPRTKTEDIAFIKTYGVTIAEKGIEELMPLNDIFTACTSATIRLALTHKKTVLNFDIFDARYSEYQNIESVITVTDKEAYTKELNLICNGTYSQKIDQYYKKCNNYFGTISDDSHNDIKNTFLQLCKQ